MTKIRFFRYIIGIVVCTIAALYYTHQEIETIKIGLVIDKNTEEVSLLLDQYRSLVYNLSRLESPKRIEDTLCANEITLCMPKTTNMHRAGRADLVSQEEQLRPEGRVSLLASIFDRFSANAEAKVVDEP